MKIRATIPTRPLLAAVVLPALFLATTACANRADEDSAKMQRASAARSADAAQTVRESTSRESAAAASPAANDLPKVLVHKSPSCGCCEAWVEHMRGAGFSVEVRNEDDLNPIKEALGVPYGMGSCHTAEVGGYFVEGHVPAEDVKRLLAEKPDAKGLALPGMPVGSPGMEMPDGHVHAYTVELVAKDGGATPFARHGGAD